MRIVFNLRNILQLFSALLLLNFLRGHVTFIKLSTQYVHVYIMISISYHLRTMLYFTFILTAILCVWVSLFHKREILDSTFTRDRRKCNNATQKHDNQTKWWRKTWNYFTLIPIAKFNLVLIKCRACVRKGRVMSIESFRFISRHSDITSFSYTQITDSRNLLDL